ncbi:branched-chain amino acid ABC transporter permease [Babesia caballi]|uniref:Branched-chain amino acid ABC transporter permease n=1 Tax=Babesia caballi TaxID=5871 RepID=A0AAV4LX54_BABCB|nr:branched-chain amino acid ABC transporter permease [Babesia caballi]
MMPATLPSTRLESATNNGTSLILQLQWDSASAFRCSPEEWECRGGVVVVGDAVFRQDAHEAAGVQDLHVDGEVAGAGGYVLDFLGDLQRGGRALGALGVDVHAVQLRRLCAAFVLAEDQQAGGVHDVLGDPQPAEGAGVAFQLLLLAALGGVELDGPLDGRALVEGVDAAQEAPLGVGVGGVVDQLGGLVGELPRAREHEEGLACAHGPVVDGGVGHDGEFRGRDPAPKHHRFLELVSSQLFLCFEVEDLNELTVFERRLECDDGFVGVHDR